MSIQNFNITIIVLLILAGVSISLVVGDNGVLTQASNTSTKTEEAKAKGAVEQAIGSVQGVFAGVWADDMSETFQGWFKGFSDGTTATQTLDNGYPTVDGYTATYDAPATGSDTGTVTYSGTKTISGSLKFTSNMGTTLTWNENAY